MERTDTQTRGERNGSRMINASVTRTPPEKKVVQSEFDPLFAPFSLPVLWAVYWTTTAAGRGFRRHLMTGAGHILIHAMPPAVWFSWEIRQTANYVR